MQIQPLRDNVIIEPTSPEEVTASGIIIPDTADKEKTEQGTVVAVGPGKKNKDGSVVSLDIKKGDVVLFSKYGPTEIEVAGTDYLIAKEEDILAILN